MMMIDGYIQGIFPRFKGRTLCMGVISHIF